LEAVTVFGTLARWANDAWNFIQGIPGDIAKAVAAVWHYVTQVHNTFGWFTGNPILRAATRLLWAISYFHAAQVVIHEALGRLARWIWIVWLAPQVRRLDRRITALKAWAVATFIDMRILIVQLYQASLAYTRQLVSVERSQRIQADQAEHTSMLKTVAALHATIEREASSGYNSGRHARLTIVERLLNDVADRQPEIRGLVSLLVKSVFDLESIDNPVLRFTVGKLLAEVIAHLGVDKITGDLISRLLADLTGGGPPKDLAGVERSVADRLAALEDTWAQFMANGGPEVEQAGREWKQIDGPVASIAILGMFGLAVADPQAFATGVSDTIGVAGNAALDAVIRAIQRV
jgi:hypothetical protein